MLNQGNYDLEVSANNYKTKLISNIQMQNRQITWENVELDAFYVDFSSDIQVVILGDMLSFYDESKGDIDTWLWEFEGASPTQSEVKDPQNIQYNEPGLYGVTLSVTDVDDETLTMYKHAFIGVGDEYLMDNITINSCAGFFYDSGGKDADYSTDEHLIMTIAGNNPDYCFRLILLNLI